MIPSNVIRLTILRSIRDTGDFSPRGAGEEGACVSALCDNVIKILPVLTEAGQQQLAMLEAEEAAEAAGVPVVDATTNASGHPDTSPTPDHLD